MDKVRWRIPLLNLAAGISLVSADYTPCKPDALILRCYTSRASSLPSPFTFALIATALVILFSLPTFVAANSNSQALEERNLLLLHPNSRNKKPISPGSAFVAAAFIMLFSFATSVTANQTDCPIGQLNGPCMTGTGYAPDPSDMHSAGSSLSSPVTLMFTVVASFFVLSLLARLAAAAQSYNTSFPRAGKRLTTRVVSSTCLLGLRTMAVVAIFSSLTLRVAAEEICTTQQQTLGQCTASRASSIFGSSTFNFLQTPLAILASFTNQVTAHGGIATCSQKSQDASLCAIARSSASPLSNSAFGLAVSIAMFAASTPTALLTEAVPANTHYLQAAGPETRRALLRRHWALVGEQMAIVATAMGLFWAKNALEG